MNQLHMWQVAVDLALVATLLMISMRWLKSRASSDLLPKTMELEASLRGLLREADSASGALTSQLRERQNHLERLLKELSGVEERLAAISPTVQEHETRLQEGLEKSAKVSKQLNQLLDQIRLDDTAEEEIVAAAPPAPKRQIPERSRERSMPLPDSEIGRTAAAAPKLPAPKPAAAAYGADGKRSISDMQRIYAQAEQLLKQGKELRHVTAETSLPEEEVRLLSQMIEIEQDVNEKEYPASTPITPTQRDSRLGVLGAMRRQTQTV